MISGGNALRNQRAGRIMTSPRRYRVLGPDGQLSRDIFLVSPEQPSLIRPECLLMVHQRSGMMFTIHNTRLFPADAADTGPFSQRVEACLRCGRVNGVAEDQVTCPYHGDGPCDLLDRSPQQSGASTM
jgi:hypothetical protein